MRSEWPLKIIGKHRIKFLMLQPPTAAWNAFEIPVMPAKGSAHQAWMHLCISGGMLWALVSKACADNRLAFQAGMLPLEQLIGTRLDNPMDILSHQQCR